MTKKSRNKGAAYEREVARELELLTGVKFVRNLEQVRNDAECDLHASDSAWPFAIECKRRSKGVSCLAGWKAQAANAAEKSSKIPAVVFRFDNQITRVAIPLYCLDYSPGDATEWAEVTLAGFASVAAEIMALGAGVPA